MSADLLREAAALMRERAEAATSGPWLNRGFRVATDDPVSYLCARTETHRDAVHISSWHPAVALAVADMFEAWADRIEKRPAFALTPAGATATAAANAYLGVTP